MRTPHIPIARAANFVRFTVAVLILLAFAGISGTGCIFSPEKSKGGGGGGGGGLTPYPPRSTPINAVLYLAAAWANRDSTRADTVYTEDYVGTSSESGVMLPPFAKSDEIRAIAGVQKDPTVNGVIVDFKDPRNWRYTPYTSDPPTWVTYSIDKPSITVNTLTTQFISNQSDFEFKMAPQVVAPGDTLWQIVRWLETK